MQKPPERIRREGEHWVRARGDGKPSGCVSSSSRMHRSPKGGICNHYNNIIIFWSCIMGDSIFKLTFREEVDARRSETLEAFK